jgi:hypothetical protein
MVPGLAFIAMRVGIVRKLEASLGSKSPLAMREVPQLLLQEARTLRTGPEKRSKIFVSLVTVDSSLKTAPEQESEHT